MEEATQADGLDARAAPADAPERRALPPLCNAERTFWRRAADLECARIGSGLPPEALREDA